MKSRDRIVHDDGVNRVNYNGKGWGGHSLDRGLGVVIYYVRRSVGRRF